MFPELSGVCVCVCVCVLQDVCGLMERVSRASGTEKKKRILASFLEQWREAHASLHPADSDTTVKHTTLLLHGQHLSATHTYKHRLAIISC